jgi:hypothetical protein
MVVAFEPLSVFRRVASWCLQPQTYNPIMRSLPVRLGNPEFGTPTQWRKSLRPRASLRRRAAIVLWYSSPRACGAGACFPREAIGLIRPPFLPLGAFVSVLDRRSCRRLSQWRFCSGFTWSRPSVGEWSSWVVVESWSSASLGLMAA